MFILTCLMWGVAAVPVLFVLLWIFGEIVLEGDKAKANAYLAKKYGAN